MIPLVLLYNSIFAGVLDLPSAVSSFEQLDGLGRRQARSLRLIVARQAMERVEAVDDEVFDFLIDALEHDFGSSDEADFSTRFGTALWRRSPMRFLEAVSEQSPIGRAVDEAISQIDADELVNTLAQKPHAADRIARFRPDLLKKPAFWQIDGVDESLAGTVDDVDVAEVALALITAGRSSSASDLIPRADPAGLAAALEAQDPNWTAAGAWLQALAQKPDKAAAVLASGRLRRAGTIVALTRAIGPDDVPNEYGDDPWWIAVRGLEGELSTADEDHLHVFLMSRALGQRSRSKSDLMRLSYTRVYKALDKGRMSSQTEGLLSGRLNWLGWLEWDRTAQLRATVVDRFVTEHLDPETFARLSDDGKLTKDLISEAAKTMTGRRYLEDVRRRIKRAPEKWMKVRAQLISEKLG